MTRPIVPSLVFALLLGCGASSTASDAGPTDAAPNDASLDAGRDGGGSDGDVRMDAPRAHFTLPDEGEFWELPWPNDLLREPTEDGTLGPLDLSGLRAGIRGDMLRAYIDGVSGLAGWSPTTPVYFFFDEAVDIGTVPRTPSDTLLATASVFMLDIDPESPEFRQRIPVQVFLQRTATQRYWEGPTLAMQPVPGRLLRRGGRYLAVVTTGAQPVSSASFVRSPDLEALLAGESEGRFADAARRYAPVGPDMGALLGIDPESVLNLAVFTVGDPRAYFAERVDALASIDTPSVDAASWNDDSAGEGYDVAIANIPLPLFQSGTYPYELGGGAIPLEDGALVVSDTQVTRIVLSVPRTAPPEGGYPLVLYGHGTGGSARSFVSNGTAAALAARGLAVLGYDQAFHGSRSTNDELIELLTFNIGNPEAFRHNALQASLELLLLERASHTLSIPGGVISGRDEAIGFDSDLIFYMGHSQGVLSAAPALGTSDVFPVVVLSGGAGFISRSILHKTEPLDIPQVAGVLLGIDVEDATEGFHEAHPMLAIMQAFVDSADGVAFGPEISRGRSIFFTQGISDPYAPFPASDALALAMELDLVAPAIEVSPERRAMDRDEALASPVRGNASEGPHSRGAVQGRGGHFIAFDAPVLDHWADFLGDAARGEIPRIQ